MSKIAAASGQHARWAFLILERNCEIGQVMVLAAVRRLFKTQAWGVSQAFNILWSTSLEGQNSDQRILAEQNCLFEKLCANFGAKTREAFGRLQRFQQAKDDGLRWVVVRLLGTNLRLETAALARLRFFTSEVQKFTGEVGSADNSKRGLLRNLVRAQNAKVGAGINGLRMNHDWVRQQQRNLFNGCMGRQREA